MVVLYAIVRIRGIPDTPYDVEYTLRLLRLVRKHHCVLYLDKPSIKGMLYKVKDWVTWGEVDRDTLVLLLRKRGRVVGDRPLTDEFVRQKLRLSSVEELADKLLSGELEYHKLESYGVKPVFRLHPPRGGFRSIKKPYAAGGDLGYRGPAINELLRRMI